MPHLWSCSRPGWMRPWAATAGGWQLCVGQWGWNQLISKVPSKVMYSMIPIICASCRPAHARWGGQIQKSIWLEKGEMTLGSKHNCQF